MNQEELNKKYEKRQNWFKSKVGKIIFRTQVTCKCPVCTDVYNKGIRVQDEFHACYLNDCSAELDIDYFETIEERNEFEKSKNNG